MEDYQYKSLIETIEKLKEYNEMLYQLKTEYHKEMLDYRMAYLKQQNKINKAIEYIEDETKSEAFHHYLNDEDLQELLDILKEVK